MFGLLKRYREIILVALLLLVPLGVYFANAKHPSERSRFDDLVMKATWPVERAIAWTVGGMLSAWNGYVGLRGAHERAQALERELTELRLEHADSARIHAENDRLARLLAFAQETPERRVVGGRVVGVRLDPKGLQLVTIDRGAREGLARMMPVVVGEGVVGRVHTVSDTTADVLLLTDRNSSVAVRVDRTRARANVRGTGSPDACKLEYALRSDDMMEGDLLVTSGTDGVFPRGLPVGRLTGLKKRGQGLYQRSDVTPAVDVTKIDEVLVIVAEPAQPDPPQNLASGKPLPPAPIAETAKPTKPQSAAVIAEPAKPAKPQSAASGKPLPPERQLPTAEPRTAEPRTAEPAKPAKPQSMASSKPPPSDRQLPTAEPAKPAKPQSMASGKPPPSERQPATSVSTSKPTLARPPSAPAPAIAAKKEVAP